MFNLNNKDDIAFETSKWICFNYNFWCFN